MTVPAPIDLESIRLRLADLDYFVAVTDILDGTRAIEEGYGKPPAAFVAIASETAERNDLVGAWRQRVSALVSVLFCEQTYRLNDDTRDVYEATRIKVIGQLNRFTPGNADDVMTYERSMVRATGGGLVWGEVQFRVPWRITG